MSPLMAESELSVPAVASRLLRVERTLTNLQPTSIYG
jgi:hypothetical protein